MKTSGNERCAFFDLPESELGEFKRKLLWYLKDWQVKKICEAKASDLATVFLDEMLRKKLPDENYELTVGAGRDFERCLGALFSGSQVHSILAGQDFRGAVIAEVSKTIRICPPAWFNPAEAMLRATEFLFKYGLEFMEDGKGSGSNGELTFGDVRNLIPCPAPSPFSYKDGIFTVLGVFLPDKDGEDGWIRTLKAWWEFLELPAELVEEGGKFIDFGKNESSTREWGVGKASEKRPWREGVRWITLDLRTYMGLDKGYSRILCDGKEASLGVLMLAALCPEWASYWSDTHGNCWYWVNFVDHWHTDSSGRVPSSIYLRVIRPDEARADKVECGMYLMDGPHSHKERKK